MSTAAEATGWNGPVRSRESRGYLDRQAIIWSYVLLCCVSLVPFLAISQPPIVDFANHAARLNIACHASNPTIVTMYRYHLGVIPNLAIDLVNAPLCGLLEPTMVLRIVTAASLALIYCSAWLIQRKLFDRANAFLFLLPAVAFNLVTTMGYINFLAGVAVSCLLLAVAIGRERQFGRLLLLCNLGGIIIFFCHLFALAFAILLFFGLTIGVSRPTLKRVLEAGFKSIALFAVPISLLGLVPRENGHIWVSYPDKFRMLPALFMAEHVSLGLAGLILLTPLYLLLRNRVALFAPAMRWPISTVAAVAVVAPATIKDAVDIDSRLTVAVAYLFFASLKPLRRERELNHALGAIAVGCLAFQLWAATTLWMPFSRQVDELHAADVILPAGAKVLTVIADRPGLPVNALAYSHVTSYVTSDRQIFNPLDFTGVGMQPLSVTPAFAAIDTPAGHAFTPELMNRFAEPDPAFARLAADDDFRFVMNWPRKFDYVIFYSFGGSTNFNPGLLSEVARGSYFTILKIRHPQSRH